MIAEFNFPKINKKEFNKKKNVCFNHPFDSDILIDNIEDYIDIIMANSTFTTAEEVEDIIEKSANIKVFWKKYYQLSEDTLWEIICDEADNRFDMDYFDIEPNGRDLLKPFLKKFNKVQSHYSSGGQVAILDISKEVKIAMQEIQK